MGKCGATARKKYLAFPQLKEPWISVLTERPMSVFGLRSRRLVLVSHTGEETPSLEIFRKRGA